MNRMKIADTILAFRRDRGMTQGQFGALLGVSAQAVSKWEREVCCPDISLLMDIADILGVPVAMLLGGNERTP